MERGNNNSCGISGVILGILGILLSSIPGIILGIVGLIFAIRQSKDSPNSWSKAGIILNIISIILGIITIVVLANSPTILQQLNSISSG